MEDRAQGQSGRTRQATQIRIAVQALLFIAIIASLSYARDFLLPVVMAIFMALTLRPAIRRLQGWYVPPWLAATLFVVISISAFIFLGYVLQPPISDWLDRAPELQARFAQKFSGLAEIFAKFSELTDQIQNASTPDGGKVVQEVIVRQHSLPSLLLSLTGYQAQFGLTLAATVVIAVLLLASGDLFYEKLVRILPTMTARKQALHIVYDIETEVSTYVLTLGAINVTLGFLVALTFKLLGMPLAPIWGILIFIFNFVPYIGTLAGLSLAAFMAIVSFDKLGYAMLVPLSYAGWSVVESEVIRPLILGRRFQMNAVAILLSLAFWSWLWGIAGAVIAMPALLTIKVFCEHVAGLSGLGEFLSSRRPDKTADEAAPVKDQ